METGCLNGWFVIQEHHATNLHFDLRLGLEGVARSWAINLGPTMRPYVRRPAREMPDHPLKSMKFEGTRRAGLYGAGEVRIWDKGEFKVGCDAAQALKDGKLRLTLHGSKLKGKFELERSVADYLDWDFTKLNDEFANPTFQLETILQPRKFSGFFPLLESLDL